jgi:DNA-binding beta-propeller fold protein YncE
MIRYTLLGFALSVVAISAAAAATPDSGRFQIVNRIAGPDGQWDYALVDDPGRQLFVGRSYGVMALDLVAQRVSNSMVPGDITHGIAAIGTSGLFASTNGGSSSVRIFNGKNGAIVADIKAGKDPDAIVFEPTTGLLVVANHEGGDVTLIDPIEQVVVGTIAVGGTLEFAAVDGHGTVWINIEDTHSIAAINVAGRKVERRIALHGCEEPTGLAYDSDDRWLISVCSNGVAKLVDAVSGQELSSTRTGKIPDAAIWDSARRLLFVPSFVDGSLTVISLPKSGKPAVIQKLATQVGTRTGALDPRTGRLYLPTSKLVPPKSEGDYPTPVPGTFEVLVIDRQ